MGARAPAHVKWTRPMFSALGRLRKLEGMDKDTAETILRKMVLDESGQTSTRKLTPAQARRVLALLNGKVDDAKRRDALKRRKTEQAANADYRENTRAGRDATESSAATVTREQGQALLQLAGLLGWGRSELRSWIKNKMGSVCKGMPWPQTRGQAMKLHEGLEAMVMRRPENQVDAVLERVRRARRAPYLTPFESKLLRDMDVEDDEVLHRWNKRQTMRYRSWRRLVKLAEIEKQRLPGSSL